MNLQMREMMERYLASDLSEIELEAFLTLIQNDAEALGEVKQVLMQQAMLYDLLRRPRDERVGSRFIPAVGTGRRVSSRGVVPLDSSRRLRVGSRRFDLREVVPAGPVGARRWQWGVAAAALVIVLGGLLALWVNARTGREAELAGRQVQRRQEILRQIAELEKEAAAARSRPTLPEVVVRPERPRPQAPKPETPETPEAPEAKDVDEGALRVAAEAERRREAEEAARLIEARRQQLLARLREFPTRRPRPDDTDEEPERPGAPSRREVDVAVAAPKAVAEQEVGRVLHVGDEQKAGVVVRLDAAEEVRYGLRKGLRLKRGDRIETPRGDESAGATVELAGGAKLDLDQQTVVVVLEPEEAQLNVGRIYAYVSPTAHDSDESSAPPFALETRSGRYLTQDARAEIFASPAFTTPETRARVDQGRIHLVNKKGLATGCKGQEIRAQGYQAPQRADGFTGPIWRGRGLPYPGLPFGKGNLLIYSNENPTRWFTEDYAMVLAHRGEIRLASLQVSQGDLEDPRKQFQLLAREANLLGRMGLRNIPQPVLGVPRPLVKPASGQPAETQVGSSAAVMQILAGTKAATPDRPLVIVCTGSLTDVASAWRFDPGIGERVVVVGPFAGAGIEWRFDPWAAEIVVRHFRCVLGGGPPLVIDPQRLSRIADRRWVKFAGKASGGDPEFSKLGIATIPGFVREAQQSRFTGIVDGRPTFEKDPAGRVWLVRKTDPEALLREFDQTFLRSSQ